MTVRYILRVDEHGILRGEQDRKPDYLIRWDEIFRIHYTSSDSEWFRQRTLILDYENGHFLEINDDEHGWDELLEVLDQHIPIQDSRWRKRIGECESEQIITIYVNDEMFKPDTIKVLLVAEVPEGDGTFFYQADSSRVKLVKEAFISVFGAEVPDDDWDFLYFIRDKGCFLVNLLSQSIEEGTPLEKVEALREQGVDRLATYIAINNPAYILCTNREIEEHVRAAVNRSNRAVTRFHVTPTEGWKETRITQELADLLSNIYKTK